MMVWAAGHTDFGISAAFHETLQSTLHTKRKNRPFRAASQLNAFPGWSNLDT